MRKDAAVAFVKQVDAHREACRAYWEVLGPASLNTDVAAAKSTYLASWDAVALELGAFQLATSPDVSQEGGSLYNALRDYSEAVEAVARNQRGASQHAESVQDAIFAARGRFIRVAQADLTPADATDLAQRDPSPREVSVSV